MQRIAIIDIGSNSARLVISHVYKNGAYNMVYNQKEALRLSQKVGADNCLSEQAFSETIETMKNFVYMCELYHADEIIAVATAAIRNADNGADLAAAVEQATGVPLRIISGNTEAYTSYIGVINSLNVKDGIIYDLGGGSTELIYFKKRKLAESVSLPFGAVNTTEIYGTRDTMTPAIYNEMSNFLKSKLEQYPWLKQKGLPLIGVGGTARAIAKIIQRERKYPATKLHNYSFSSAVFKNYFNKIRTSNQEQRTRIAGLSIERSDIILAGSSIVACLVEATGCKKLITSGCGLREGLFCEYYAAHNDVPVIAPDILERSRENILKFYVADIGHARLVTRFALRLFDNWNALHKLRRNSRRLLETAALLHDIGITINFYSHARHSAYMIQNAQLFGLTHKEQLMTSAIAGWHHGASKNYFRTRFYKIMLTESNWKLINKLALILALAESLDYTQTEQIRKIKPYYNKKNAVLELYAEDLPTIELQQLQRHAAWFKKIYAADLVVELHRL